MPTSTLRAYLEAHPDGVAADAVARDVLALSGPEVLLRRLGEAALTGEPGVERGGDGRWRLAAAAAGPGGEVVAVVGVATGSVPGADVLLGVAVVRMTAGGREDAWEAYARPTRRVSPERLVELGVPPGVLAAAAPVERVLAQVGERCRDGDVVTWRLDAGARWLRARLGLAIQPLVPALRGAGHPTRHLPDALGALGVTAPTTDGLLPRARAIAALAVAVRDQGLGFAAPAPPPPFDFAGRGLDAATLDALPETPGVYRFFDRDGQLLYVGKARSLRQRVWSYFQHREERRRRHAELVERVHTLRVEETGSELNALLVELRAIRSERPALNVQLAVHHRREAAGTFALFLPGPTDRDVDVLFVRDGRVAGRARVDRRGRGMRAVRGVLREAVLAPTPPPPPQDADAEAQIVASWLAAARSRDRHDLLDLSAVRGIAEAARLIRAYATDPDLFEGRIHHR